ncbi:MAG TPA: rhomboid family intramembrane serine protease [Kofleriaceae bacterium]
MPPKPWVVYALIAANVAAFMFELSHGLSATAPSATQLLEVGGSFPPLTTSGQWWRLGSSMFLHAGVLHLGMNMLCLYRGAVVEALFGRARFLAIYALAGLGGGVATLIAGRENTVTVGASGAVFGVYGAFGAFLLAHRSRIDNAALRATARQLATFLVINFIIGYTLPNISMSAHVGGLATGFAAGFALSVLGSRGAGSRRAAT